MDTAGNMDTPVKT